LLRGCTRQGLLFVHHNDGGQHEHEPRAVEFGDCSHDWRR
jgi:hypothetical protein